MHYKDYKEWLEINEEWFNTNWYKEDCDCVACARYRFEIRTRSSGGKANE